MGRVAGDAQPQGEQEQEQVRRAAEVVALQARLLLFQAGPPGSLLIRRGGDGRHRIELEYEGAEKFSARGGLLLIGQTLAEIGSQFHCLGPQATT